MLHSVAKIVPWAFPSRCGVNQAPFGMKGPWVDSSLIGVLPTAGQTIEDSSGQPIRVDTDIVGKGRVSPVAGPLADLRPGENTVKWSSKMP